MDPLAATIPGIWEILQEKNPAASRLVEFKIAVGRLGNSQRQVAQALSDNDNVLNIAKWPASLNVLMELERMWKEDMNIKKPSKHFFAPSMYIMITYGYDGFDSGMDAQGALRSKWLANIKDSNHDFGMKDGKTVV